MASDNFREAPQSAGPTSDERTWAMLCHLSGLASYLGVIPFASVIGPLIVWMLKKDSCPFVDEHGKESLNFQITMSIAFVIGLFLCIFIIGFFLLPFLGIWMLVLVILASVKAFNGGHFRYPLTIRLVK